MSDITYLYTKGDGNAMEQEQETKSGTPKKQKPLKKKRKLSKGMKKIGIVALGAASLPTLDIKSSFNNLNATDVSVVVPDLEITLIANFLFFKYAKI